MRCAQPFRKQIGLDIHKSRWRLECFRQITPPKPLFLYEGAEFKFVYNPSSYGKHSLAETGLLILTASPVHLIGFCFLSLQGEAGRDGLPGFAVSAVFYLVLLALKYIRRFSDSYGFRPMTIKKMIGSKMAVTFNQGTPGRDGPPGSKGDTGEDGLPVSEFRAVYDVKCIERLISDETSVVCVDIFIMFIYL